MSQKACIFACEWITVGFVRMPVTRFAGFVGMAVTRFALSNVAESMHCYVRLNNCRVCKHVCARVCHGNCHRIQACLCQGLRASEQLIRFVGMSATRFASNTVAQSMHFCMQVNNCRVCRHV